MIFTAAPLDGAYVIEPRKIEDDRGFFARSFCQKEFIDHSLKPVIAQANIAFNKRRGTVRGIIASIKERFNASARGECFYRSGSLPRSGNLEDISRGIYTYDWIVSVIAC